MLMRVAMCAVFAAGLCRAAAAPAYEGLVLDDKTGAPVAAAAVTLEGEMVRTDRQGRFRLEGAGDTLKFRAAGYAKREISGTALGAADAEVRLAPFAVKGLYLTVYGMSSAKLRGAAIAAVEKNRLNALVIDVKGDRGFIPFRADLPLARQIGAQDTILVKDMASLVAGLKQKNLYLIARVVVLKDDLLAKARPDLAVRTKSGGVYTDREHLRWVDPFQREVWDYNIAIAKTAAELGFDEIQFDYVRFPDARGVVFSRPATVSSRTEAITGFLHTAYRALSPYNVLVAADIFGYVPWNDGDTDIGQEIVPITEAVDVVCPMLYPSGYRWGIPQYRHPVQHPYQIVYLTLEKARERTGASPLRFRPWLQAFRDYAFHGGDFGEERMRSQSKAADDFGAGGWMFWNPRNVYPTGVFTGTGE